MPACLCGVFALLLRPGELWLCSFATTSINQSINPIQNNSNSAGGVARAHAQRRPCLTKAWPAGAQPRLRHNDASACYLPRSRRRCTPLVIARRVWTTSGSACGRRRRAHRGSSAAGRSLFVHVPTRHRCLRRRAGAWSVGAVASAGAGLAASGEAGVHGDEVRAALTAAAHTWSHCRKHRSGYGWPGCWRAGPVVCVWIGAIVPRAATAAVGPPPPSSRASYRPRSHHAIIPARRHLMPTESARMRAPCARADRRAGSRRPA